MVTLDRLVRTGCEHGLHVTNRRVFAAVDTGEIVPHSQRPLTFTTDAANRWLAELARRNLLLGGA
jgi:hypothetical protein